MTFLFRRIAALFLILFTTNCTTTVTDGLQVLHEEKIIMVAYLQAGKPIINIHLSRSNAVMDTLSPESIYLPNASIVLTVDGQRYKGVFTPDSIMVKGKGIIPYHSLYSFPNIIAESGKEYEIEASWHGKTIHSRTQVPFFPMIIDEPVLKRTIESTDRLYSVSTMVRQQPNQAYGFYYYSVDTLHKKSFSTKMDTIIHTSYLNEYRRVFRPSGIDSTAILQITTRYINDNSISQSDPYYRPSTRLYAVIESFDGIFYDIWHSRGRTPSIANDIFSSTGGKPVWNVIGDGFGIFIGMATIEREVVDK